MNSGLKEKTFYKISITKDHHDDFRFTFLENNDSEMVRMIPDNKLDGMIYILEKDEHGFPYSYKILCMGGIGYDDLRCDQYSIKEIKF